MPICARSLGSLKLWVVQELYRGHLATLLGWRTVWAVRTRLWKRRESHPDLLGQQRGHSRTELLRLGFDGCIEVLAFSKGEAYSRNGGSIQKAWGWNWGLCVQAR